jgi:cysteinyl-tRNA synthetase
VNGWQDSWQEAKPAADLIEALEDDLNTPRALAALFGIAREINRLGDSPEAVAKAQVLRASAETMGLLASDPAVWFENDAPGDLSASDVDALLQQRNEARASKDYAAADRIRDELAELGVAIEDSSDGTRWSYQND